MLMSTSTVARSLHYTPPSRSSSVPKYFKGLLPAVPVYVNPVNLAGVAPCRGHTRQTSC